MFTRKLSSPITLFVTALLVKIMLISGSSALAETKNRVIIAQQFNVPFNPPKSGKPLDSVGGASRSLGQCPKDAKGSHLTPLIPANSQGLTLASHPTFFIYLPATSAQKALLSIQDEGKNEHYQTILPIKLASGVISVTLPEEAPELQVGKNYKWSFVLMCDNLLRPDSPTVEGTIQRIELNTALKNQLQQQTPIEQASLYASNGIWHETLTTLMKLRTSHPDDQNLVGTWQKLLTSVGLGNIADKPIVK